MSGTIENQVVPATGEEDEACIQPIKQFMPLSILLRFIQQKSPLEEPNVECTNINSCPKKKKKNPSFGFLSFT